PRSSRSRRARSSSSAPRWRSEGAPRSVLEFERWTPCPAGIALVRRGGPAWPPLVPAARAGGATTWDRPYSRSILSDRRHVQRRSAVGRKEEGSPQRTQRTQRGMVARCAGWEPGCPLVSVISVVFLLSDGPHAKRGMTAGLSVGAPPRGRPARGTTVGQG